MRVCAFCGAESPADGSNYCQSCGFRIRAVLSPEPDTSPAFPSTIKPSPHTSRRRPQIRRTGGMLLFIAVVLLFVLFAGPVLLLAVPAQEPAGDTLIRTAANLQVATISPETPADPDSVTGTLTYVLRGGILAVQETIPYQFHRSAYQKVTAETPRFYGDEQHYYLQVLDDPVQRPDLAALAERIRSITDDPEDQARIAISAVQHIPYDTAKAELDASGQRDRYPLEVLHDDQGLCGEKSLLLASLLRDLGFGVALFEFKSERHMAVGIRCPAGYDFAGTGYAFVESTEPSIMTDSSGNYAGVGKLTSVPEVIPLAGGAVFSGIGEEGADAKEWRELQSMGRTLDEYHYARYLVLKHKYGLVTISG